MKNKINWVIKLATIVLLGIFLHSCKVSENITFKPDNTGEISYDIDGGQFIAYFKNMGGKDSTSKSSSSASSSMTGLKKSKMDTVFNFSDILSKKKDSISKLSTQEQAVLKMLEKCTMKISVDESVNKLLFSINYAFKDINEAQNMMSTLNHADKATEKNASLTKKKTNLGEGTKIVYSYKNNTFTRTETISDKVLFQKSQKEADESAMFLQPSTFTFNYNFPKPIKSAKVAGASVTFDKTNFSYSLPYLDYLKNPEKYKIEIEF
jgi:hypothetical protein